LSQLLSKVTVTSFSFYIISSMCPPSCWTTHSESVLLQKSRFQLLLLKHWHFTRLCSDTLEVWLGR